MLFVDGTFHGGIDKERIFKTVGTEPMRKTKAVELGGATYVVKELTPLEIDGLFDQSPHRKRTMVDDMLDVHQLDTALLGAMLGVTPERCAEIIGQHPPSQYGVIIDASKEMNPDFFEMARRRVALAGQIEIVGQLLAAQIQDNCSGKTSDTSSCPGTQTPPTTA